MFGRLISLRTKKNPWLQTGEAGSKNFLCLIQGHLKPFDLYSQVF